MNTASSTQSAAQQVSPIREPVHCPKCQFRIYDGEVIRSRCVHLVNRKALCRCKSWVPVPVAYQV